MKPAFIFPGQGSQYVGMGKDLNDNFVIARRTFEESSDTVGFDIGKLCFEGPEDELKKTSNTQPAILTVSVACLKVLNEQGVFPGIAAGHSLGEYSALVAAEAINFAESLRLIQKRAQFMQEAAPANSGMAAILGLGQDLVVKACREASVLGMVEVANYNCPGQIVIAGENEALQKAMDLCKEFGAKRAVLLQVSGPFHTSLMAEAGLRLAVELDGVNIKKPACPVMSNVTSEAVTGPENIRELLVKQVSSSVRWEEIIKRMFDSGIRKFVEIGPGKVLNGLGRKIIREGIFLNVEDTSSLENTLDNFKEV